MELTELIAGPALIAVTALMVMLARPKEGEPAHFIKYWPVGQAYTLAAMGSAVLGIALLVSRIPAVQALQH
jgi:hypothetical protein